MNWRNIIQIADDMNLTKHTHMLQCVSQYQQSVLAPRLTNIPHP